MADTLCAHSHQQMPPDCARNNQLYMPNLMRNRQIRGGIRIPGPWRTALPFGLKEQFHWGEAAWPPAGPTFAKSPISPIPNPGALLVGSPRGCRAKEAGGFAPSSFISLFGMSSSMHGEEFTEIEQENQFNYKRNQKNEAKIRSA